MASGDALRAVRKEISTAAKIRMLAAQGRSRADIARALGIRYQHVRNVLMRDEAKAKAAAESSEPATMPGKIRVGPDGSLVIPANVIGAAAKPGEALFVRIHDGEVLLLTREAVTRRVQALAREFVPEGVSLVDELLEDRRREVEAESRHD
jgi:hypothetical protein